MKHIPLFCPNCNLLMADYNDAEAFFTYACCNDCRLHFVEQDKDAWLAGRRPDDERINRRISMRNAAKVPHFNMG